MDLDTEEERKYDKDKEEKLGIKELHVLSEGSTEFVFNTENINKHPDYKNHVCDKPTLNSKGPYPQRHFYDRPTKLGYIIKLNYNLTRFKCTNCKITFAIPTSFVNIKTKTHYTYRLEKWISQLCLNSKFSSITEEVRGITPKALIEADEKIKERILSESGIKKCFKRWLERQDEQFLGALLPPQTLGIHKTNIGSERAYILTNYENYNKNSGFVVWLGKDLREIRETLKNIYTETGPETVLVDWDVKHELLSFAKELFPKAQIRVDAQRVSRYMSECIDRYPQKLSAAEMDFLEGRISYYENCLKETDFEDKMIKDHIIKTSLSYTVFHDLCSCVDSIMPTPIEMTADYWEYIDEICVLLECNYGCSIDAARARILYKVVDESIVPTYTLKKMNEAIAASFLCYYICDEQKQVFPRYNSKVFSNKPFNAFINCELDDINHINYGVPFDTAIRNLRSTIQYHEAYDYYLAHSKEVMQLLEKREIDDFIDYPEDI